MINLETLTIHKAHKALIAGDFTVRELIASYEEEIKKRNPSINAFIEIFNDLEEQSARAQKMIEKGEATLLTGIPVAIKDNLLIKGKKVSAGSKILEGYKATYNATVIERLMSEGAIFLGRTNMDEFAMGSSTETSFYGPTKNPLDEERIPGGSSGGSAAAVAMNGALISLGSDTGGSIRQPASLCGIVGFKPTYGTVSRFGLIALASSLDQIGPLTKTVEDAKIVYDAIKGEDKNDSTTFRSDTYSSSLKTKNTYTIGVPENFISMEGVGEEVLLNFRETIKKLEEKGHTVVSVDLPLLKYALPVYYIIMPAEASTNLARFDGVRYGFLSEGKTPHEDYLKTRGEGFGKEVRRRILLGTHVLSSGYCDAYYNKAIQVREKIKDDFLNIFKTVDVIVTPTTPNPAFKIGEKIKDPLSMYLEDIFTVSANIAGIPSISIPSGFSNSSEKKLPLGFQILGAPLGEDILFDLGQQVEGTL